MLRTLALTCALGFLSWQPALSQDSPSASRPVREVTERADPAKIEFVGFDFQQPTLMGEFTVHYVEIEGAPSMGEEYGVEASIGGQEAIATLLFEAIGADGALLQTIPMVVEETGVAGYSYDFIGLMTVPSQPFRVRLSGDDVYGQRFTRLSRLINPVVEAPRKKVDYPGIPPELLARFEPRFDEVRAERRALALANSSGQIVSPRTRISNVRYAPLISETGKPLGFKITYEAEFSQAGRYNPALHIAEDQADFLSGRHPLVLLRSSVQPVAHDPNAPLKEAEVPLAGSSWYSPDFLYKSGTRYQFAAEMVPDFVGVRRDGLPPCLWKQPRPGEAPKAFARRATREEPTTYRVTIGGSETFEGRIDGFYGEGTLFRSFVGQGLAECEPSKYQ